MVQSRKHHFIPAFYLKNWAGADGKLIEWSRPHRAVVPTPRHPNATGYQFDLNRFDDLPPDIASILEDVFLKNADDDAARALQKLFNPGQTPWDSRLRSAWSRFLIALPIRHPEPFEEIKAIIRRIVDIQDQDFQQRYEATRTEGMPPTFNEHVQSMVPGGRAGIVLHFLQRVMDNSDLGPILNAMHWGIIDLTGAGFRLLTSDRPAQFTISNGVVALPVSPTKLFLGASNIKAFQNMMNANRSQIVRINNEHVVKKACRYVFSSDLSQKEFIIAHMSEKMGLLDF